MLSFIFTFEEKWFGEKIIYRPVHIKQHIILNHMLHIAYQQKYSGGNKMYELWVLGEVESVCVSFSFYHYLSLLRKHAY